MDRLSQRDVMKLRPHPGTTILFCAIEENPRRKKCRVLFGRLRPVNAGSASIAALKQSAVARLVWHRTNKKKRPCYQGHM